MPNLWFSAVFKKNRLVAASDICIPYIRIRYEDIEVSLLKTSDFSSVDTGHIVSCSNERWNQRAGSLMVCVYTR